MVVVAEMSTRALTGRGRRYGRAVRHFCSKPSGAIGAAIVSGLVICAIFAPLLAPYEPDALDISQRLEGPSSAHVLGTDNIGRDLLSRLLFGTRIGLIVGITTVFVAVVIGVVLGIAAGYLGKKIDTPLLVIIDTILVFPAVILAICLLALLGPSLATLIIVLVITFIPGYARVARSLVLQKREQTFVQVEEALGASKWRVARSHLLPNIIGTILVLIAMDIPTAIVLEAGFSFIGLGAAPPTASWGVILNDGFAYVRESPWAIIWVGAALAVVTIGFTLVGQRLRDVIDPKSAL